MICTLSNVITTKNNNQEQEINRLIASASAKKLKTVPEEAPDSPDPLYNQTKKGADSFRISKIED